VKGSAYAVEKFPEAVTVESVLDVAVIRMTEDVEHAEAHAGMLLFMGKRISRKICGSVEANLGNSPEASATAETCRFIVVSR